MACGRALGVVAIRREGLRRDIIFKLGVPPSVGVRESLGILLDELNLSQGPGTVSGVLAEKGASVIFAGFHSIFAILEPSGKGLPLPGMPPLYALIITGLARISLRTFWASV